MYYPNNMYPYYPYYDNSQDLYNIRNKVDQQIKMAE